MMDYHTMGQSVPDEIETDFTRKQASALDYDQFLARDLPPRENMLAPWLPKQGIALVHAARGIGKTHFAHAVAWTIAVGGSFLRWSTPAGPFRVLLLDGEMPGVLLQERFRSIVQTSGMTPPLPEYMQIAAADLSAEGLPDLADADSHRFYADITAQADLIVVDNLSTLCRSLKENEADSWGPVQAWCLAMRRMGKSVLLVHHDGKNGGQRGTSKKEDVADTVVSLRRPPDYQAGQGARFEIHFTKSRGFFGTEAEPFEVQLVDGRWQDHPISFGVEDEALASYKRSGMSVRDIAERTGVPRSTVHRRLADIKTD